MKNQFYISLWFTFCVLTVRMPGYPQIFPPAVEKLLNQKIEQLQRFMKDPVIVKACRDSSKKHASFSLIEIQKINQAWVNSWKSDGVVPNVFQKRFMINSAGLKLIEFQDTHKGISKLLLTDAAGINVAMTNKADDYWQANDMWWQTAYHGGGVLSCPDGREVSIDHYKWDNHGLLTPEWLKPGCKYSIFPGIGGIYKGKPQVEPGSRTEGVPISIPVLDPDTKKPIGVCKISVDLSELLRELK